MSLQLQESWVEFITRTLTHVPKFSKVSTDGDNNNINLGDLRMFLVPGKELANCTIGMADQVDKPQ